MRLVCKFCGFSACVASLPDMFFFLQLDGDNCKYRILDASALDFTKIFLHISEGARYPTHLDRA